MESCIGGFVVVVLIEIFGLLGVFEIGFVIYLNDVKLKLLKVSFDVFDIFGVVLIVVVWSMV